MLAEECALQFLPQMTIKEAVAMFENAESDALVVVDSAQERHVIGLLTDSAGEPLAVRVFKGNTSDPTTVADQVKIIKEQFQVEELVFVGDRG